MKPAQNNRPYGVFVVENRGEGAKPFWHRIGAAWPNSDGNGFNLKLVALPLDGQLVIRAPKADVEVGQ
jgi:hypothetical protein